jgi:hypothetical protein
MREAEKILDPAMLADTPATGASGIVAGLHRQ